MCRGCLLSRKYSVICAGERCRPNHVLHQNKNGISTISHATKKKSSRLRSDMWWRDFGLATGSAAVGFCESGDINVPDGMSRILTDGQVCRGLHLRIENTLDRDRRGRNGIAVIWP